MLGLRVLRAVATELRPRVEKSPRARNGTRSPQSFFWLSLWLGNGSTCLFLEDGISIPANYTSFVSPLAAPKLYNELATSKDSTKALGTPVSESPCRGW